MILETDRLTLRPLQSTDVEAVASYSTKPEFIRFLPLPPQTMESATEFVGQAVANGQPDPKGDWLFAIQIREEPRLIGIIRIGVRSVEYRQGDLGYAVHPDHWGKGFATEALRRILEFGFEDLSLERIWATADVMEKAGMEREGFMRHHLLVRGAWRDSVLYARINPTSQSPLPAIQIAALHELPRAR
jgi:RimJ/RimL family protein N-acetyltransferase